MHFAIYPAGTFYKRHANHFNQQAHRYMTFVFYLNNKWFSGDCGDLVIYRPKKPIVTIAPTGGALAIFMRDLEHEVLLANAPRYSLTG
jgi:SM-20-related protein